METKTQWRGSRERWRSGVHSTRVLGYCTLRLLEAEHATCGQKVGNSIHALVGSFLSHQILQDMFFSAQVGVPLSGWSFTLSVSQSYSPIHSVRHFNRPFGRSTLTGFHTQETKIGTYKSELRVWLQTFVDVSDICEWAYTTIHSATSFSRI